ncbi:hypothetical protein AALP_AA8G129200 [Arabis alpina]|uniref:Uncharacterized protein n=1 Tax=Arabis alpina TaxID=50452 RepID=A0A087G6P7_ARAAL|nr:hypothetical protein AALP_AA8G129200 [Arabis alpina]
MKMKKKGKVYPSPNHSLNEEEDSLSVLKLLPTTILVLVSVLSLEDREVLAYLITRGTTINPSKKNKSSNRNHKPPIFDCECFDCYTNYWFRWDSSPNRELIHEIIEAFEEHQIVVNGENSSSSSSSSNNNKSKRGKKKEKVTPPPPPPPRRVLESVTETTTTVLESEHVSLPDKFSEADVAEREPEDEESTVDFPVNGTSGHKGLARKVLPDVLGLFNSNFWRLWNPNA